MSDVKLFIIAYESMHWCGGSSHCLVYARNESQAKELADQFMDENMRDLFSGEYECDAEEGGDIDEEAAHTVNSVEELTPEHEYWVYVQDEVQQRNFYPYINTAESVE